MTLYKPNWFHFNHTLSLMRLFKPLHNVEMFIPFAILSLCIRDANMEGRISSKFQAKIVGGFNVPIEKFPYAVQIYNYGSLCGGSILSSWTVMTAAHCFDQNKDTNDIQVHVGARYTFDMAAAKYVVWYLVLHQDYNKDAPFASDIALIFVSRPMQFSKKAQKAILVNSNNWMDEEKENLTATGWGRTSYEGSVSYMGLMEVSMQFVSSKKCSELQPGMALSADMFCLYGDGERDTCQGDSGGAVLWNGLVVGLVSHGDGCARKDRPGVYTNVFHFRSWIETKIIESRKKFCIYPPI